jgi:uncharacterized protein YkwD
MSILHRTYSLALMALVTVGLLAGPLSPPAVASVSGSYERAVSVHSNRYRAEHDRVALTKSTCLDRYAERQARRMANKQRMYHQDMGPILRRCHLSQVGENVAVGFGKGKAVTRAWMRSPGHRDNLLNERHRLVGVGAYRDAQGRWYVSQVLGLRA